MSEKSVDTSTVRIAADILIAGFQENNSFTLRDSHSNTAIAQAICANFTAIHAAVLAAKEKEFQSFQNGKIPL